jgi:hypothetical protein
MQINGIFLSGAVPQARPFIRFWPFFPDSPIKQRAKHGS